ncbi:MAG: glutathione S-transferase [Aquincola sp.]|nr:glutathione S-transferase [Aquincola sp.]MDH5329176.1 glutathione S-transferase [Aquincola sp.]
MITVHHLENSRSQRVLWLLEELELTYHVKRYARDRKTSLAPPELTHVHPLGKSPVITDGAVTVAETGAIVEYLVDKAGGALRPEAGTADHRRYTYWLHFAEGSAMTPLLMALVFRKIRSAPMPFFARPIARAIADNVMGNFVQPNLDRNLAFMESELGQRGWFVGDSLTAADVMMSFPVEAALSRGGSAQQAPRLAAFLETIRARSAWKRALDRGGPYQLLG